MYSSQELCGICLPVFGFRLKDPAYVVNAFNVDPLYLKHDQQGAAPDYRVSKTNCIEWLLVQSCNFDNFSLCKTAYAD
jgi:hypothetical protein